MKRVMEAFVAPAGCNSAPKVRGLFLAAAVLAAALASTDAQAVVVTNADGVCAPAADPCNVTTVIDIPQKLCSNNSNTVCTVNADCVMPGVCNFSPVTLDFGARDVNVSGAGQFNFGQSSGTILTGGFSATTTGVAIKAFEVEAGGGTDSGSVHIYARRLCTENEPLGDPIPCLSLSDCQLGSCSGRCALRTSRQCVDNAECSAGPCRTSNPAIGKCDDERTLSCTSNADCELGSCSGPTTCRNRPGDPIGCTVNADCDFGTCTVGTGSIVMGGSITGNSEFPAFIDLRAADNITVSKTINVAGTTVDSDGGEVSMDAGFGSVTLAAGGTIIATGGGFSTGGDITLYAGTDVTINADITLTGGDSDGGALDVEAARDVTIGRSINANATAGAGFGGDLTVLAGRDLVLSGVSSANKTTVSSSGNTDQFNDAGDGGYIDFSAERNTTLNINTRVIANGAVPYGYGGDLTLGAYDGNMILNGDLVARGPGAQSAGGVLDAFAGGTMNFGSTGTIDLTGGADGGGEGNLESDGNFTYAGQANMSASNTGTGGSLFVRSESDATISGVMTINTGNIGRLDVNACRITLTATADLDSDPSVSENTLTARESMRLLTGSKMRTGAGGSNFLRYRTASKPPLVQGTVTPAPILEVNPALLGCPVCGNSELDQTETCDDGNTANGDGCNSDCQNENCVAQTTATRVECAVNADCDAPRTCDRVAKICVPWLCEEGNLCTTDTCNTAVGGGTCQHAAKNCADSVGCTIDSCVALTGACLHLPNNTACNDGNSCTNDVCSVNSDCQYTGNSNPCDDGNECTENDTCVNQQCTGTPIGGCGVCGDGEINGSDVCDDGNATFAQGEYCGAGCAALTPCGDPNASGSFTAGDAQFALRAAVGQVKCCFRVCDVNSSGTVVASDAQQILRKAVGQTVTFNCPTTGVAGCPVGAP